MTPDVAGTVAERYRRLHGDHPMTEADDAYVRQHFVAATHDQLVAMLAGHGPLPSYLLADGTPMVPADWADPADWAGGTDRLHDWFLAHWPDRDRAVAEQEWAAYLEGRYVGLAHVTPIAIRRRAELIAQLEAAVAALAADPHDHVARGSLGEAVSALDDLLLPTTAYDELRFGAASDTARLAEVRRAHLTPDPPQLPIRTERLLLRRARHDDAADMFAYYGRADVARYLLHPTFTRLEVDDLLRRRLDGPPDPAALGLVLELDGTVVGDMVVFLKRPSLDLAEIGWVIHPDHAGRGLATEAATAMLDVAFDHYGVHRVHAELDALNERSAALARRLGMRRESDNRADFWSKGRWADSQTWAIRAEEWAARRSS